MSGPTNDERADHGAQIMAFYRTLTHTEDEPANTVLCDVLADLRHYGARDAADYDAADSMAEIHFEEERGEYFGGTS